MKVSLLKIPVGESKPQIEVRLNTPYRTNSGNIRTFTGYSQEESDILGQYRTAFDKNGHVYARIHNEWGCDNGRVTGTTNDPDSLLVFDNKFVVVEQ